MNQQGKKNLQERCLEWLSAEDRTQAQLARMTGLSASYLSKMVSGKWTDRHPTSAQWNKLAIFFNTSGHVDSGNFNNIQLAAALAHKENRVISVSGFSGAGKSYSLKHYARENAGTFYIAADTTMTKRAFLHEIARKVGAARLTSNSYQLGQQIVDRVRSLGSPTLLIFDEIEYLPDSAWHIIKSLMDALEGYAGFIVSGIFKEILQKKATRERPGMPQFLRRVGHSWVDMQPITYDEVRGYCLQNDITAPTAMRWLHKHSGNFSALTTYVRDLIEISRRDGDYIDAQLCSNLFQ